MTPGELGEALTLDNAVVEFVVPVPLPRVIHGVVRASGEMINNHATSQPRDNEGGCIDKPASLLIDFWFVLLNPQNLGSCGLRGQRVATRVENVVSPVALINLSNLIDCPRVDPVQDSIAQGLQVFIDGENIGANRTDSHTLHLVCGNPLSSKQSLTDVGDIAPPGAFWIVFRPPCAGEDHFVGLHLRGHNGPLGGYQNTLCFVGSYVDSHQ